MSYHAKKRRSFRRRCFIGCQKLILLTLIFTLSVLLCGLGLTLSYDELPVPNRLLQLINRQMADQGLELDFEKINLDVRGNLLIQNARISFVQAEEPALEAELVYLDVNYPALLLRRIPIDRIGLSNATFYGSAMVTITGAADKLLEKVHLSLTKNWSRWEINYLTAQIQQLRIAASGDVSALVEKLSQPREKENEKELYYQYLNFVRLLSEQSKNLATLQEPTVHLRFSSPKQKNLVLNAGGTVERFSQAEFPTIKSARVNAEVQLIPEVRLTAPIHLTIGSIEESRLPLEARRVELFLNKDHAIQTPVDIFPVNLSGTTGPITIADTNVKQVVLKGQLLSQDHADASVSAALYDGSIHLSGTGNWKEKTAAGRLSGKLDLDPIINRPELDHLWKLRWSKQFKPIFLDAKFGYTGNLDDLSTAFRIETRDIEIIKTPFQWARLRGTLNGTSLTVPRLEIGGHGNDLLCSFNQELKQPFYRFTAVGKFRPHDIDIWWRDWWKKTFDYLDIKEELPWMDLSIRNAFVYKKQLSMFAHAEGENINLKNMHFDRAEVRMYIRPNYIDALNLQLERPEGEASGEFQRHLVESRLKNVIVDLESNLDLEPSMELFGESGLRIIEPYTWEGNPKINLQGEFNFENDDPWQDLLFKIETEQAMTLYDFPFDNLFVEGHYDHGDVLLHEVDFGFAGGEGHGEASFLRQDEQAYLIFDFDIENAELEETLRRIGKVRADPAEGDPQKEAKKKDSEPLHGKLKIHASGISPAGQGLDRVMAKGNIEVTDGNLAQIPLFGPLSSLLPFTKLRLSSAETYFAWDDGKMSFPNLRMRGPTARLDGIGDYYTSGSNLDFQVKVYLLREADIPLVSSIIMPLFDPFSNMAAVNLKGTLANPEWRFAISPFNLFDEKPTAGTEIPKEELLEFEFRK